MIFIVERKCYYSYSQLVPFPMYSLSTQNQEPDLQTSLIMYVDAFVGYWLFFFVMGFQDSDQQQYDIDRNIYICIWLYWGRFPVIFQYYEVQSLLSCRLKLQPCSERNNTQWCCKILAVIVFIPVSKLKLSSKLRKLRF